MTLVRRVASVATLLLVLVVLLGGCRVEAEDMAMTPATPASPGAGGTTDRTGSGSTGLPAIGPVPGASHWHAPYVVRICNDVLAPFDSEADPLGIHSHQDGVIHVHPFVEESGYENATLSLFADAMGLGLADGELRLPGGGVWRDGDLCDGAPGRVFVDRWEDPDPGSAAVRHFEGLADLRFLADGELYQIAFAPEDSVPVVPPARSLLPEISDLSPPPEPWVDLDEQAATGATVRFFRIGAVESAPCGDGAFAERVLRGPVRCFVPEGEMLEAAAAVRSARAVELDRQPAVEIVMGDELQSLLRAHFRGPTASDDPFALAIALDGEVVSAPQVLRLPDGDRLVISGGFSTEAAIALAGVLTG